MCGINGFNFKDEKLVHKMNEAIKHRGPDAEGIFSDDFITLGHRRLAIIDLSEKGNQPMCYVHNDKKVWIVYNGEIYNYKEIKNMLSEKGYVFFSKTDTEVILASYFEWGFDCVKKFDGMWAFAIYDPEKKIIFLSRDRFGVKPLYYYYKNNKFIFSSELKGLLAHNEEKINEVSNLSKDGLQLYFAMGYIPSPYSIFNNVYKLEPSQNIIFNLENGIIEKYYYYKLQKYKPVKDKIKTKSRIKRLLKDATEIRLIADVDVGAFLSGGLDSSTIVSTITKIRKKVKEFHTYSIGFKSENDETRFSNIIKDYFNTNHHHLYYDKKEFKRDIGNMQYIFDEPVGDIAYFPIYAVSKIAKKNVKVALTGDGGDEVFGGYPRYVLARRISLIKKFPVSLRKTIRNILATKLIFFIKNKSYYIDLIERSFSKDINFFSDEYGDKIYKPDIYKKLTQDRLKKCKKIASGNFVEMLRVYDICYNTLGDNYLMKADKASMASSLELRSPFLDYRIIEESMKIPSKLKVGILQTKKLMRKILKGELPKKILRRKKTGFSPPFERLSILLNTKKDSEILDLIAKIDPQLAKFYREEALKSKDNIYRVFKMRLLMFVKWYEKWVVKQ